MCARRFPHNFQLQGRVCAPSAENGVHCVFVRVRTCVCVCCAVGLETNIQICVVFEYQYKLSLTPTSHTHTHTHTICVNASRGGQLHLTAVDGACGEPWATTPAGFRGERARRRPCWVASAGACNNSWQGWGRSTERRWAAAAALAAVCGERGRCAPAGGCWRRWAANGGGDGWLQWVGLSAAAAEGGRQWQWWRRGVRVFSVRFDASAHSYIKCLTAGPIYTYYML